LNRLLFLQLSTRWSNWCALGNHVVWKISPFKHTKSHAYHGKMYTLWGMHGNWGRVRVYTHSRPMFIEWQGVQNCVHYLNFLFIYFFARLYGWIHINEMIIRCDSTVLQNVVFCWYVCML
jgi:hypothetical protein